MSIFKETDVVQFAIRMEEDGELFYREVANRSEKFEVKKLFNELASEEADHKRTFEEFLLKVDSFEPPEDYPGEYMNYIHNYIDSNAIFSGDKETALAKSTNVAQVLEFAIQREIDSILYYNELKAFVPVDEHATLDMIIDEERKHFSKLSNAKKNL